MKFDSKEAIKKVKENEGFQKAKEKIEGIDKDDLVNKVKTNRKYTAIAVIGVVCVLLAIVGIFKSLTGGSSSSNGCEYGSTCSTDNFNITLSNVEDTSSGIKFDFEFENKTDDDYSLTYTYFTLVDNDNVSYSAIASGNLVYDNVVANTKKNYTIYFEGRGLGNKKEIRFKSREDSITISFDGDEAEAKRAEEIAKSNAEFQAKEDEKEQKEAEHEQTVTNNILDSNKKVALESINYLLAEPLTKLPDYSDIVILAAFDGYTGEARPIRKVYLDRLQKAYDDGELTEANYDSYNLLTEYKIEINDEAYNKFYSEHPEVKKQYSGEVLSIATSCKITDTEGIDKIDSYSGKLTPYVCGADWYQ